MDDDLETNCVTRKEQGSKIRKNERPDSTRHNTMFLREKRGGQLLLDRQHANSRTTQLGHNFHDSPKSK